jgi:hypothetical protein
MMSYNKQTSLAANVEAIETAVKIHVQGRKAMAKEKETLSRYSGFGGIKEVLNIGTDNPLPDNMAEPMNRLQKALRTLAGGEETMYRKLTDSLKASVLTAFYTPQFLVDAVARQIRAAFTEYGLPMRSLLEPSAGIGGFLPAALPDTRRYAFEKDCISGLILARCTARLRRFSFSGTGVFPSALVRIKVCVTSGSVYSHASDAAAPNTALTPGHTSYAIPYSSSRSICSRIAPYTDGSPVCRRTVPLPAASASRITSTTASSVICALL